MGVSKRIRHTGVYVRAYIMIYSVNHESSCSVYCSNVELSYLSRRHPVHTNVRKQTRGPALETADEQVWLSRACACSLGETYDVGIGRATGKKAMRHAYGDGENRGRAADNKNCARVVCPRLRSRTSVRFKKKCASDIRLLRVHLLLSLLFDPLLLLFFILSLLNIRRLSSPLTSVYLPRAVSLSFSDPNRV